MTDGPSTHIGLRDGDLTLSNKTPSESTEEIGYTPATCDPDGFTRPRYNLRNYGGDIELFIAVTLYNEDVDLFSRTIISYVTKSHRRLQADLDTKSQSHEERWSPLPS